MAKQPTDTADSSHDYRGLSAELAAVIAKLEDGDIDIDEAVSCYERGLQIVNLLETRLLRAENRVVELKQELGATDDMADDSDDDADDSAATDESTSEEE